MFVHKLDNKEIKLMMSKYYWTLKFYSGNKSLRKELSNFEGGTKLYALWYVIIFFGGHFKNCFCKFRNTVKPVLKSTSE